MTLTVKQRADAIGTFRAIEVRLMETLAYWTPITPQMELKVLFGRHIWDHAQHADWLGKRTFELRQPEHYTKAPAPAYAALLDEVRQSSDVPFRIAACYDVVLPGLIRRYESYLAGADPILDAPSVLVMERILTELRRQLEDARSTRSAIDIPAADVSALREREAAIESLVAAEGAAA